MSRTVKEALRIARHPVNPMRLHQTITRRSYNDGGDVSTGEPMSVPEKPETIRMQLRQLANGKRSGVFVARGTKGVTLPEGMRVAQMREGNIIFDPSVISKEEVIDAAQSGRLNELLGYVQSKPEALAQSLELGELPRMVVSRDENGVEQDSAAVSPDRAEEQAAVFADRARGGSTISTEHLNDGVLRDRMAEGGVPDEESQEEFLKKELEGSAPQYDPEAGLLTGKKAALFAAGLLPGSGIASAAGKFPTVEGGYEPSAREDWKAGNYGSAALKAAGAAGDVVSAIPVAGTAAGALLKAPLAAKLAMAAAPMAKIAKEAAPAAKAAEEVAKPAYQRLVNPAGFYSRAHEVASTILPEGPRTWQEMRSLMMKQPGMKEQEMVWSGLHPEAYEPGHKLTREEIAEQVQKNFPQVNRIVKKSESVIAQRQIDDEFANAISDAYDRGDVATAQRLEREAQATPPDPELTRMSPMHEQYTVPGGKNYSERVLTHASDDTMTGLTPQEELEYTHLQEEINPKDWTAEHQKRLYELTQKMENRTVPEYIKTPFRHEFHLGDIDNPIVHTRNSERVGPNGEKILHQEELQSDWGQQGREKGFKEPLTAKEKEELEQLRGQDSDIRQQMKAAANADDYTTYDQLHAQRSKLFDRIEQLENKSTKGIPNAPFVGDTEHWLELAAKDTLAHAIENDFDKIFITGGQEQAKRWSNELRKAVDNVRWEPNKPDDVEDMAREFLGETPISNAKTVYAKPVGSATEHKFVVQQVEGPNGKPRVEVVDSSIPSAKGETLSAVVGGDLAKRIMAEESGNVPMKGYRMGSEGYTQTYERKAPSVYKKLMKTLDPEAKVEAGPLERKTGAYNYTGPEITLDSVERLLAENPNLPPEIKNKLDKLGEALFFGSDSQAAMNEHGSPEIAALFGGKAGEAIDSVHGTYLHITPKMKENYRKLKAQHGSVFPAYKKGGTVDAEPNSRYTGADRRLLERALRLTRKLTE